MVVVLEVVTLFLLIGNTHSKCSICSVFIFALLQLFNLLTIKVLKPIKKFLFRIPDEMKWELWIHTIYMYIYVPMCQYRILRMTSTNQAFYVVCVCMLTIGLLFCGSQCTFSPFLSVAISPSLSLLLNQSLLEWDIKAHRDMCAPVYYVWRCVTYAHIFITWNYSDVEKTLNTIASKKKKFCV